MKPFKRGRALVRQQRALLVCLLMLSLPYVRVYEQVKGPGKLLPREQIAEVLRQPESALASGMRVSLDLLPLDLIEQVVGLPASAAEELWKKRKELCLPKDNGSITEVLQTVPGIGPKRAEQAKRFILLRPCRLHGNVSTESLAALPFSDQEW